ncbi:MAG: response regulator [Calothrix sp. SM1_5_4]|nr:response regulator [Calothrix sp. SM1_5_4]
MRLTMERFLEPPRSLSGIKSVSSKRSILVVDDDLDSLDLQRTLLEIEGYEVFTAESGMEALELLSQIDEPNLILLDMQMGQMNGVEFLIALEKKRPEIIEKVPVIFLTGMDVVPLSKAAGFIRKPADKNDFLKAVDRFVKMGFQAPYKH